MILATRFILANFIILILWAKWFSDLRTWEMFVNFAIVANKDLNFLQFLAK